MKNPTQENILIAKFMGMVYTPTKTILLDKTANPQRAFKVQELDYHKNWNSLMDVVLKIEKNGYVVSIQGISCKIYQVLDYNNPIVSWVLGDKKEKISLVHKSIIQFLKTLSQDEK